MPELPEVEVTRLGITAHLQGARVRGLTLRDLKLAGRLPAGLSAALVGEPIQSVERRGKYLLLRFPAGTLLVHLGMTGHLRILPQDRLPGKHDLFDLALESGKMLRLNDSRHFGSLHWTSDEPLRHRLLSHLGPEPLTVAFTDRYLYEKSRGRRVAIQRFIMDGTVVAGVGNIYAAESLFRSALLPTTLAGSLTAEQCRTLAEAIKAVLGTSIATGSSGMDFCSDAGRLVYYPQQLMVYGREKQPCRICGTPIQRGRLGNRSTFYCPVCQK
ncbi:bifunctional DNA-formamidopyrimidine glycosylase/DNA-(apurinic or apyrimidinic site) lyase [Geomesophilobacter sediminis]|uniref:Formamidopyrimidine-DNA glycosylase n=1 Tax=Geomesophilobacter sediminis TaxID=2798584 RepID=A0A8J7LXX8_9BACT|nr:bifunctional DNA-formamidopyrimidine glycosylase/DNA-(apurinic or apyrimidinic site) lyase [Geomesophilobacter sediminis]MBJ6723901.1 bifunctional DNA-formamidopyrimidine glycosylase/DNA-(apurinic or apyrimidinic site) lyase [Geomesophilobacter sediminis]